MFGFSRTRVGPTKDESGTQVDKGEKARSQSHLHDGFDPVDSEEPEEWRDEWIGAEETGGRTRNDQAVVIFW